MIKTALMYGYDKDGITNNLLIINGSYYIPPRLWNGYGKGHLRGTTLRIIKL